MATVTASVLRREFVYNGTAIPDPNPSLSAEQVRDTLVPAFPEIATAALTGPEVKGDVARYTFTRAIGTKG
jgi:PRTRC genetic system protein C